MSYEGLRSLRTITNTWCTENKGAGLTQGGLASSWEEAQQA